MVDVAIVSFAQTRSARTSDEQEVQLVVRAVSEAVSKAGIPRGDIGFTCSGSSDYVSGAPFSFVRNLEGSGAWPPIHESHLEMDGAWALYEAWVRLQHGDIDSALVYASGMSSSGDLAEVLPLQLDPYYLMPLWPDPVSLAALQATSVIEAKICSEEDMAAVAARSRMAALDNPNAQIARKDRAEDLLAEPYLVAPLRRHDCPPISDGAAAVVLVAGERANELCERPVWIRGMDHRIEKHYPGLRDLTASPSTALAARGAGLVDGNVEVAELSATFTHQEFILRNALGLRKDAVVNPSGGPLAANPLMATGLIRIIEAARAIAEGGYHRTLAHATSGPCLQQNLVCLLEAEE